MLPLNVHAALKSLVAITKPFIDLVRKTDVSLEVRCYKGHRSLAFANILNSFS